MKVANKIATFQLVEKYFRQAVGLLRKVQDAFFFAPKAYSGTPRGRKNGKYMRKSGGIRCSSGFCWQYCYYLCFNLYVYIIPHICSCDFIDSLKHLIIFFQRRS